MKNILIKTLLLSSAFFLAACSSSLAGASKLILNVDSLSFTNENGVEGFKVDYSVRHNSLNPMPIDKITIDVYVNGKKAAHYEQEEDSLIAARLDNHYSVFVPANCTNKVARKSLKQTPMLQVQARAEVNLIVEEDIEDSDSLFNKSASYEGVIHASANK
ncbi:MAG: hypothetical protein ACI4NE_00225 [Succinivibrio sp.]